MKPRSGSGGQIGSALSLRPPAFHLASSEKSLLGIGEELKVQPWNYSVQNDLLCPNYVESSRGETGELLRSCKLVKRGTSPQEGMPYLIGTSNQSSRVCSKKWQCPTRGIALSFHLCQEFWAKTRQCEW